MKRIYIILSILLAGCSLTMAQHSTYTDYFIKTSQTRSSMNPAFTPRHGYVGFPLLSNIYVDVRTNTLNLDHLTFQKGGAERLTFMHPDVTSAEFLDNMADNNYLAADFSYKMFTAGFYAGKQFWTLDLGIRAHADLNITKGLFNLLKEGFSSELTENSAPIKYDMKNIGGSVSAFGELAVGYSRSFLKNSLSAGIKTKVLLGLGNVDLNIDRLDMEYGYNQWKAGAQASLSGSVNGISVKYKDDGSFDSLDFNDYSFGFPGWGLGFDLGVAYDFKNLSEIVNINFLSYILERTRVSMAFTDIGFISWGAKSSIELKSPNTETVIDFGELNFEDEGQLENQITKFMDDIQGALNLTNTDNVQGRSTSLRTNMNIGLEYEFWKDNMSLGLLSSTQFEKLHNVTEFTMSVNYNPIKVKWIAVSLSYSFIHSRFNTFGFALHLAPSKGVNLFIASDYIIPHVSGEFIPTTSRALNVQFGMSIPLGSNRLD